MTDLWELHLKGKETSLNPLGLVTALIETIRWAAIVNNKEYEPIRKFTQKLKNIIHRSFVSGKGTRDLVGPEGLTTEEFVDWIGDHVKTAVDNWDVSTSKIVKPSKRIRRN